MRRHICKATELRTFGLRRRDRLQRRAALERGQGADAGAEGGEFLAFQLRLGDEAERHRVLRMAVAIYLEMPMRAGRKPGRADKADHHAAEATLHHLHRHASQMLLDGDNYAPALLHT